MKEHVIYCTDIKYEDGIISATITRIHSGKVYHVKATPTEIIELEPDDGSPDVSILIGGMQHDARTRGKLCPHYYMSDPM